MQKELFLLFYLQNLLQPECWFLYRSKVEFTIMSQCTFHFLFNEKFLEIYTMVLGTDFFEQEEKDIFPHQMFFSDI